MNRNMGRVLALAGAAFFVLGALQAPEGEKDPIGQTSGRILMVGSSSMETYALALAEGYMEHNPQVHVWAESLGSSAGIEAALAHTADIGNSSRPLTAEEQARGAVETVVAWEAVAVCVDPSNPVKNLTREQLAGIYTGEIRNWSELGGPDLPVVTVGREAGSGIRSVFEQALGIRGRCAYGNELNSSGAVRARVAFTPGAIGYIGLETADETVTVLQVDGETPTEAGIRNEAYPLYSPFCMVTWGDVPGQSELVQDWFRYVLGEEGRGIAVSLGLIPAEEGSL